jgi:hypothetical protein
MSEFSTSYHIRVDGDREVQKLLRDAKLAGITFGPGKGWLTFVPYAGSNLYRHEAGPHFADKLSRLTLCTVLYYSFAEDHGWGFALARPDRPLMQHECLWNPSPPLERKKFDPIALNPFVSIEEVEPLLDAFDQHAATQAQPAYRFAELLGLPAYKWLSPELVQNHTGDYLKQSGRKLGVKPTDLAARLGLPPDRQIAVPHDYLGAREALDLILPFMARFKSPWDLSMLTSYGPIRPDGRGNWQARWLHRDSGDTVAVALFGNGSLSFRAYTSPLNVAGFVPERMEAPKHWLDSPDIVAIAAGLPIPNECVRPQLSLMALRSLKDCSLSWELHFNPDKVASAPYVSWTVYIHAISGDVMAEQLGRLNGYEVVPARRRVKGGDWENLEGG